MRLAEEVDAAGPQELHQQVRRVLKPKRYRRPGADPLPLLLRQDGSVCQTYEESLAAWRTHFGDLEDGVPVSASELVQACRARQVAFTGTDLVDIREVPTFRQFECSIRASAPGKAAGPDLLPPALLKYHSHSVADLLWPLLLKVIFSGGQNPPASKEARFSASRSRVLVLRTNVQDIGAY